jgi:hypothetical protein
VAGQTYCLDFTAWSLTVWDGTGYVDVAARRAGEINVLDFMTAEQVADVTSGTAALNVTAAINAAVASAAGKTVRLPPGNYLTDGGHTAATSGTKIIGAGIDATKITLRSGTAQSGAFILGNKTTTALTRHVGLRDLTIEVNGQDRYGLEMYGCRDGSYVNNVYVSGFTGSAVRLNMAGNGTGSATRKMNQGVALRQVVAESNRDITAPSGVFDIDGTFESTCDTCAYKGATAATNTGVGFSIGSEGEVRNFVMINTTIAHIDNGYGIHYGEWAREARDSFTTFENINGSAVLFDGGTASGNLLPFMCYTLYPRLYIVATAGILDPAFVFGAGQSNHVGPIASYATGKAWAQFLAPNDPAVQNQRRNSVEVWAGGVAPDKLVGTNIVFDANTPANNIVYGWSAQDTNARRFLLTPTGISVEHLPNGGAITHGTSYDSWVLGGTAGARWQDGSDVLFSIQKAIAAGQTGLYVRYDPGTGLTTQRVTVGAVDTGGAGYRVLRVPN